MNKALKNHAEDIIYSNTKYFMHLINNDQLAVYLCESLSTFAFFNQKDNTDIENELYDIFIYLFYNNQKELEQIISDNKYQPNEDVNRDTLFIINQLLNDTIIEDTYKDIINLCNTMAHKLHNLNYEEFLLRYVNKTL